MTLEQFAKGATLVFTGLCLLAALYYLFKVALEDEE